jgi:hypothetical protein
VRVATCFKKKVPGKKKFYLNLYQYRMIDIPLLSFLDLNLIQPCFGTKFLQDCAPICKHSRIEGQSAVVVHDLARLSSARKQSVQERR